MTAKKRTTKAKTKKKTPPKPPAVQMSEEQKELFDQLTNLQKNIVTHAVAGKSNIDAYLLGGGKAKVRETQESCASEIMHNPKVKAFMDSMKSVSISNAIMERDEAMVILSNMARADLTDVVEFKTVTVLDEDGKQHRQSVWAIKEGAELNKQAMASLAEVSTGKDGLKVKQHNRQAAIKQLADMQGWNKPTEIKAVITQEDRVKAVANNHVVKDEPLI